jgi:hypothetical protein
MLSRQIFKKKHVEVFLQERVAMYVFFDCSSFDLKFFLDATDKECRFHGSTPWARAAFSIASAGMS